MILYRSKESESDSDKKSYKEKLKEGLKKARTDAGLSQTELVKMLDEKGIKTSIKTVRNWEQNVKDETLPHLNTLLKLAEFYDCDLDHLIKRIDCKTHDLQFIHDQTGLSEGAIKKLQKIAFKNRATGNSQALSFMIEDPDFEYLLALMSQTAQGALHDVLIGNAYIQTEKRAVINSETRATFNRILDHVKEKMETVPSEHRQIYNFAYGLHAEGRLTDDQLSEVIEHYDKGEFDFTPSGWNAKNKL